jgi:hypothetical protein
MHLNSRATQRRKEGQPLDMIHMQVGEQDVHAFQVWRQIATQSPDARTGIQNEQGAILSFN